MIFIDFIRGKTTKTLGPFKMVYIEDVALVADKKEIAFFNRDESFWSENWNHKTAIDKICVRSV